ncbi:TrkH family potassium uptake protein [Ekhidna sp.]
MRRYQVLSKISGLKNSKLVSDKLVFIMVISSMVALILDYGYREDYLTHLLTDLFYVVFGIIFFINVLAQFPKKAYLSQKPKGYFVVLFLTGILAFISLSNTWNFVINESTSLNFYTAGGIFILTLFDFSGRLYRLKKQTMHPALVFALSFAVLICIGTLLLMVPNSSEKGIDFIDAIFTATSAVCVTGLIVVDTGKDFTITGQFVILGLIQLGGLGMLSFTALFAVFFKGFGSFESRLNLKNMINAQTLDGTFKTLLQIIFFVFLVEAIGAIAIYYSLGDSFESTGDRIFFSVFHTVSAFCNAGFSTLTNSLHEEGFRFNYPLHTIIAFLIIFGGLGYGVAISSYVYLKKTTAYWLYRIFKISWKKEPQKLRPHLGLNARIVINTTIILILTGFVFFYFFEEDNTLVEHSGIGKIVTAFFGSVTTRTAGFNTVDTGSLGLSTIMIVIFLMWIGASPGSTGGGIKTTTFAISTLNIIKQIFGYKAIIVGYKRISTGALQRASAIIFLSLIVIGISIFLLLTFDGHLGIMEIAFESISAFSTVGLSMGITNQLSDLGKVVIILTMFIGRVGFLTILTGLVHQLYQYHYSPIEYPEEEIFIN